LLLPVSVLAVVVAVAFLLVDLKSAVDTLSDLHVGKTLLLVAVAIVGYAARYLRWRKLLTLVANLPLPLRLDFAVFAVGTLLIFTPARAGEAAKAVYARTLMGVPARSTLSVLVAERINDVLVMAALSAAGLLILGVTDELRALWVGLGVLAALGAVIVAGAVAVSGANRFQSNIVIRTARRMTDAARSSGVLIRPEGLAPNVSFGFAAWIAEVVVYFLALGAVGVHLDAHMFVIAIGIYPLASLGGALSLLPAGLGATEGGLTGLAVVVGGLDGDIAVAATLVARTAVLGSVILIGILAIPMLRAVPSQFTADSGGGCAVDPR
jgi:uncharacterized membrane protein YbhN (UPF0104 family)